jgi:hypothetical protein
MTTYFDMYLMRKMTLDRIQNFFAIKIIEYKDD